MRIYLDACAIIYSIEGVEPLRKATVTAIANTVQNGGSLLTSRLSRIECRVKPMRENNALLLNGYDSFFGSRELEIVEVSDAVIERATELRAKYNFKVPDALHLATAIHSNATALLTGDAAFSRCPDIKIELIA